MLKRYFPLVFNKCWKSGRALPVSSQQDMRSPVSASINDTFSLDRVLHFNFDIPKSRAEKLVRQKRIKVYRKGSGKTLTPSSINFIINDTDEIIVKDDSRFGSIEPNQEYHVIAKQIIPPNEYGASPLTIQYEDDHLLVLMKDAHLKFNEHLLCRYIRKHRARLQKDQYQYLRVIDMPESAESSGLVLLAKNNQSAEVLSNACQRLRDPEVFRRARPASYDAFGNIVFESEGLQMPIIDDESLRCDIEKEYWAISSRKLSEKMDLQVRTDFYGYKCTQRAGKRQSELFDMDFYVGDDSLKYEDICRDAIINFELGRPKQYPIVHMAYFPGDFGNKFQHHIPSKFKCTSITNIKVIGSISNFGDLLSISPETERIHQIRAHCAGSCASGGLGIPILGENLYSNISYKRMISMGWGNVFDFNKYTGIKSLSTQFGGIASSGMPLFLHLRQLRIKNYFKMFNSHTQETTGPDLVIISELPQIWKEIINNHSNAS
jgi:23S rRNA-/tRNA-specific pseudouridylate synthase